MSNLHFVPLELGQMALYDGEIRWPTVAELDAMEREQLSRYMLGGLREPFRATIQAQLDAMSLDELRQAGHGHEDDIPF